MKHRSRRGSPAISAVFYIWTCRLSWKSSVSLEVLGHKDRVAAVSAMCWVWGAYIWFVMLGFWREWQHAGHGFRPHPSSVDMRIIAHIIGVRIEMMSVVQVLILVIWSVRWLWRTTMSLGTAFMKRWQRRGLRLIRFFTTVPRLPWPLPPCLLASPSQLYDAFSIAQKETSPRPLENDISPHVRSP